MNKQNRNLWEVLLFTHFDFNDHTDTAEMLGEIDFYLEETTDTQEQPDWFKELEARAKEREAKEKAYQAKKDWYMYNEDCLK